MLVPANRNRVPRINAAELKVLAAGREIELLEHVAGIPLELLDGSHHPCPRCGGTDRFRMIGAETGAVFCNQCFSKGNGDFLSAIQWMRECSFGEAIQWAATYLGLDQQPKHSETKSLLATVELVDDRIDEWLDQWASQKTAVDARAVKRFPVRAVRWQGMDCLAFEGRTLDERDQGPTALLLYRVDGNQFPAAGKLGARKTHLLRGSKECWLWPGCVDELHRATTIVKCEGLPDALALLSIGLPEGWLPITNACGAMANPKSLSMTWAIGKTVLIVGDADTPGQTGAKRFSAAFANAGADVCTVSLPFEISETHGKDLRDWLSAGNSFADFEGLVRLAEPAENTPEDVPAVRPDGMSGTPIYVTDQDCLCVVTFDREGNETHRPLCNFDAWILQQTTVDDGNESTRHLRIAGKIGNRNLKPADVPMSRFGSMNWVSENWGTIPIIYPGRSTIDHLRCAIQSRSNAAPERTIYSHLGWREIDGRWVYLHCEGAIGAHGSIPDVHVEPPEPLARFALPDPPAGKELADAVKASLALIDLGPDHITVPLLGATYRAAIGGADYSLFLSGRTGTFKTQLAALAQQHFGRAMDGLHLPGGWKDTGNAAEGLAFHAKDALMVIDDFCPVGSSADVQRYHATADRVFRGAGNHAGRRRCRADGSVRPDKPPRCFILATGEDIPQGHSCRARLLIVEVSPGDVHSERLTSCQQLAADGIYASAMSGFVQWLAPRLESIRSNWIEKIRRKRQEVTRQGMHARTPTTLADMLVCWETITTFAFDVGAIGEDEASRLAERARQALDRLAANQNQHHVDADPVELYFRLLGSALRSGRCHLVDGVSGDCPREYPAACGWREDAVGSSAAWRPLGNRIGWIEKGEIFLDPDAAYSECQELGRSTGQTIPIAEKTLRKRMRDQGKLLSHDVDRYTIKRSFDGGRPRVLHVSADTVLGSAGQSGQPGLSDDDSG